MNEIISEHKTTGDVFKRINTEISFNDRSPKGIVYRKSLDEAETLFNKHIQTGKLHIKEVNISAQISNQPQQSDLENLIEKLGEEDVVLLMSIGENQKHPPEFFRWLRLNIDHLGRICRNEKGVITSKNVFTFLLLSEPELGKYQTSTSGNVRDPNFHFI